MYNMQIRLRTIIFFYTIHSRIMQNITFVLYIKMTLSYLYSVKLFQGFRLFSFGFS